MRDVVPPFREVWKFAKTPKLDRTRFSDSRQLRLVCHAIGLQSTHMGMFDPEPEVDIACVSGAVRATIRPRPNWFNLLIEAAIVLFFGSDLTQDWHRSSLWYRGVMIWAVIAGILGWLYEFSGSEIINIDAQQITLEKDILFWRRIRQYPTAECSQFEVRYHQGRGDVRRLQFKKGWRTIRFGGYMTEQQGAELIKVLYDNLSDVARKLGPSSDSAHFTTLKLS